MNTLRIAWSELSRLLSLRMGRITVLALVTVPTIYAGLYLYANHDPYSALDRVPTALVVEDTGATGLDGKQLDAGREVADQLLQSADFGWHEVDRATAKAGVDDGTYDFALLIPRDFSAALTSSSGGDPEQARITMLTNDANSYLSTTIANTVATKVRDAIGQQVSKEAVGTFLLGIADVRQGLQQGADGAGQLHDGLKQARRGSRELVTGSGQLADGTGQLHGGATRLHDGLTTLATRTSSLPQQARKLASGARQVADGDRKVADAGDRIAGAVHDARKAFDGGRADLVAQMNQLGIDAAAQDRLLAVYDRVGGKVHGVDAKAGDVRKQLNQLAAGAGQVAAGADQLARSAPALVDGIRQARNGAGELESGAARLDKGAGTLHDGTVELRQGLRRLTAGAGSLRDGLAAGVEKVPDTTADSRERIAATIADPIDVRARSDAAARNYGAGLAPFFLALAAWIGGYVLFLLVRPLSSRALAANQHPLRIAVGGWLPPALIGATQMTLAFAVVALTLDVGIVESLRTWLFMILISATFVAIVHLMNALLGTPGQFLALVLMVVQLVTAGGTFPWQTIPEPLHWLHQVLPMSYAVDGLRQLMYGGDPARASTAVLVLVAYLAGALVLTSLVARRHRVWTPSRVKPTVVL
ncbi:YhgE/Pip domain-containing protein [Nocardioides nitrophenolicus]|uniref:YhgE/Pip domain-containing protein n=1 Tax=Nocardioides nitrophenolicus TaxID=60489 RepID=UPI0019593623|nr:YhgE/Pip domain-containing protein [Nocardioides nitrophenolicus]MBM7515209.1 putative membrane protein [Nocardioides nitrophenolicus]